MTNILEHIRKLGFGEARPYKDDMYEVIWIFDSGMINEYTILHDLVPDNMFGYTALYNATDGLAHLRPPETTSIIHLARYAAAEGFLGTSDGDECLSGASERTNDNIEHNQRRMIAKKKVYILIRYILKQLNIKKSVKGSVENLYHHSSYTISAEIVTNMGVTGLEYLLERLAGNRKYEAERKAKEELIKKNMDNIDKPQVPGELDL